MRRAVPATAASKHRASPHGLGSVEGLPNDVSVSRVLGGFGDDVQMLPGETLAGVLDRYALVAARTDEIIATLPDLDACQSLPEAP